MPKKKYAKLEDVAELVEQVNEEVLNTQAMVHDVKVSLSKNLDESEERLLDAIRGMEVRKEDFEALETEVRELGARVSALERKRGSRQ